MVRVPGSSGDSGFHLEFQEDVKDKEEHREYIYEYWIDGSIVEYSKMHRSAEHEADLDQDPDLEEKPRIPLMAVPATTADLDENLDPYTIDKETTKSKPNPSTKLVVTTRSSKKKMI
ncbi:hypothetical protein PHMEG_00010994 [Phytophthora megakarya]|uniref:Uncharacterized protein n=1 Tax=Phytophthora megakarya TaxID=4795 RepID=A0A225WCB1_9STRA|nr:hypothetical protein PHMEG_00010994 [Phytophthora megakarya]